ncbi:oxidoreductase [Thalassobacillus devorans]|uniref:Oxidoreductase n=1 Tax=Thalassobacillus devorans TaxID=279813 RepID=A0ABQ1NU23_9BACI|nr:Gfo/Idh/MocA family oxidoreductase [Thalassobacillus devorans]NIK28564.1 putative dehydrogenase [Thalassobacillus devorans]GGC85242.1 oxidoreductase [Thalassobacillus devorans]
MGNEQHTNRSFYTKHFNTEYLVEEDKYLFSKAKPQYRFNIIGAGMIGHEHIRVTMLEGRATINGIYDVNSNSLENTKAMFRQEFPGNELMVYDSLHAACNDPEVDGLIVCTPNYTHLEIVKEAAKSGKHILLEKPMATTLKDAAAIKDIADEYKGVLQIGLQYRHKSIYDEAIHETFERKALGDVKNISIVEHRIPFLDKVNQWNKFSKYSGGTLVEKCCHYFDLMNLFAQSKPVKVFATGGQDVNYSDFEYGSEKSDIVDNAIVTVIYENGVKSNFNLCMFAPMFYEEITICGDQGRLRAYENRDFLPANRPKTHLEVLSGESKPSKISTPCYPTVIQESGHHGATYYEHKYFIDNIEGKTTNTASVEDGFWSVVVGVAAEESIKSGEIVNISDILEKEKLVTK